MAGRIPLGLVTNDTVDTLFAEIGVDDNGGDNPDNDLVIRDSNRNVVLRYDESAGAWVPEKFAFEDSTADPSANGEFQRNGADLKAYSGGAVRNLSDIGAGALTDSGADTDGGDDYTLPNAADNINLQGDGAIQNADSVSTDELNNTIYVGYDDDLQSALNQAQDLAYNSGTVRLETNDPGTPYNFDGITSPITVPEGVTLDMQGCDIDLRSDNVDAFLDIRPNSTVLAGGAHIAVFGGSPFDGSVFRYNADQGSFQTDTPTCLFGYPFVRTDKTAATVVELVQTTGNNISNVLTEVSIDSASDTTFDVNSAGTGGFVNLNKIRFYGHVEGGNLIHQRGDGNLYGNWWQMEPQVQVEEADRIWYVENGEANMLFGSPTDVGQATETWEWTSGAGEFNTAFLLQQTTVPPGTNNSGSPYNWATKYLNPHIPAADLSQYSGYAEGEVRLDDGTNTTAHLPCVWTGSAWQPSDGSATF